VAAAQPSTCPKYERIANLKMITITLHLCKFYTYGFNLPRIGNIRKKT
jgi:hypothetical protein